MSILVRTHSAAETREVAAAVACVCEPGDLVVLAGDLGTGKTTFAQGFARGLGVTEPVTSPTFTIVQEYEGATSLRVAHVDVYRLERLQELHDLGFEEIVDDARITMIEWGDRVAQALPADHLVVEIEPGDGDERVLHVFAHGPRWHARRQRLASALAGYGSA